eukprot:TRINITY_DN1897_c0_g1_i1.p1 TRINITY_DN1897_c0_g1~~TRINITY_DN1897_c0_g1_i1.p1  ORF type:complete len:401 (+),score=87.28 TRINITY_DN1897_c0_g1_i1:124-1203(+)
MEAAASTQQHDLALHLLFTLKARGTQSPWTLLCRQDKTLREFYEALEHLKKNQFVTVADGKIDLTEAGKKHLIDETGPEQPAFDFQCAACEGKGYAVSPSVPIAQDFLVRYNKVLEGRPLPEEKYDQTSITAEDAIIRVGFFHERGDLVDKSLLMIGDFDCLSIVAAMSGLPKRVLVLDVDDRLIAYINKVASDLHLENVLKAEKFDVRLPLPSSYQKAFDVFSCDPVETLEGIKLYLSRGTSGLRGVGSSAYIGLTTLEASRKKWFDIQKVLFDMQFVVTDLRRNFNSYPDTGLEEKHIIWDKMGCRPDCTWYWAALLRVEAVAEPTPAITGEYDDSGPDIYVDDEAWATPILDGAAK